MAGDSREGPAEPAPAGSPSTTTTTAAAPPSIAKYLWLDPAAAGEQPRHHYQQQQTRVGELRRALQSGDPTEELRRFRDGIFESGATARDRERSLQDAVQRLDRYKNIVTRKRQRSNSPAPGAEKLGADGTPSSGSSRARAQSRNSPGAIIKRVRSSLLDGRMEGRGGVPTRQGPVPNSNESKPLEKEKICARTSVTLPGISEDKLRGLSTGGEGWEKKLKRKRSLGTMLNRHDADGVVKSVGQHKPANEAPPCSSDGLALRHGASVRSVAGCKMDSSSRQNNFGSRVLSKIVVDHVTLPNERRVQHAGLEKDCAVIKGNKVHTSDRSLSPSPKTKACRSPRTSSLITRPSSTLQRSAGGSDECEQAPSSNKVSPLRSMASRKCSSGSTHLNASSPISWVGQRPQKMSRTRRANVVSPVSDFDDVLSDGSPLDTAARLSESGVLAVAEAKAMEKVKNSGVENEDANAIHNAAASVVSSSKNREPSKEELEHGGVHRQGRSGRGTMNVKGHASISEENLGATGTRKPLKCGRTGRESKVGRPLMTKGSDRKASACQAQALNRDSRVITEVDREELLAAVNAARSAIIGTYSSPFWKEMEPMLTFISSENLDFLKHQIDLVEELEMSMLYGGHNVMASADYSKPQTMERLSQVLATCNSSLLSEQRKTNVVRTEGPIDCSIPSEENHSNEPQNVEADEWFHEMAPMAHRLLSALIIEDDSSDSNRVQSDMPSSHVLCSANRYVTNGLQVSDITSNFGLSVDFTCSNNTSMVNQSLSNGYAASSNFISSNSQISIQCEILSDGFSGAVFPEYEPLHDLIPQISQQCHNPGKRIPSPPYEYQYSQISVNDKILIELESIGICPETLPNLNYGEDEDINKMISELRRRLHDQVKQKKCGLHKLDKVIQDTKNIEERILEQHALNKLVENAHRKLQRMQVNSRHKSANKAAKDLAFALAFAKRTLARCQNFERTKKSCFSEPSLWSLLSAPFPSCDAKSTEGVTRWKKGNRERHRNKDASAKGSGPKSGRHSSGTGRSGERKNKTKSKQKLVQLSTSGNFLGRVVESSSTLAAQEHPEPAGSAGARIAWRPRNAPGNAAQRSTNPAVTNLPGLDDDILDVPGGLDVQGNDFSSWFPDGLDDSLPQDDDFSGALEVPDDDLTELGFM
ncbi:hypothetical protein BRADI_2g39470v3 [Brachypodium distachyon]|uniref:Uncharacterized protein n=1 Tax=Brachypodium distachyon TaxID=15368 RepID=A0A2K2DCV5_BRADI|nr:hypothetical protein BRADI_2g39470v3 [Brachypodium distachyon]